MKQIKMNAEQLKELEKLIADLNPLMKSVTTKLRNKRIALTKKD